MLVLATILVLTKRQAILRQSKMQAPATPSDPKPLPSRKVLVLYSQLSSKFDQECILENVVKALSEYGVDSLYYDCPFMRGSITDFLATNVKCCDKILLICNKKFALEWGRPTASSLRSQSLVYVLRQLIDSYIKHDKKTLEKFAILYLRRKDQACLNDPYLKNLKSFLVDPKDVTHIARFIFDTPTYTLP